MLAWAQGVEALLRYRGSEVRQFGEEMGWLLHHQVGWFVREAGLQGFHIEFATAPIIQPHASLGGRWQESVCWENSL
jgi:hypothetical protein